MLHRNDSDAETLAPAQPPASARPPAPGQAVVPAPVPAPAPAPVRADASARDAGMATAEYAMATLAACGFAGLLIAILRSSEVRQLLLGVIRQALALG